MKGFFADSGGAAEMFLGLLARIGGLTLAGAAARHKGHVDGNLDFENVDAVLGLGKFLHALRDDFRLLAREGQPFSSPPSS